MVRANLADGLLDERVPAFALQTLVENAVRHGAAPRVAPTQIVVTACRHLLHLSLSRLSRLVSTHAGSCASIACTS